MKVALVHDWLVSIRGVEKVLESFCRICPQADLFTLHDDAAGVGMSPELGTRVVSTSFIDRLPRGLAPGRIGFRLLLPLFPLAVESFSLDGYDLVISDSHAVAKGAIASPGALHVSYVHSPMRYIWEAGGEYAPRVPGGAASRMAFAAAAHHLRLWDMVATMRVDALVANSRYTVRDGETGVLFSEPTPESLGAALTRLRGLRFDPARLRAEARCFDRASFERRFAALVDERLRARTAGTGTAGTAGTAPA